ncbi:katanin p60 ATPase-containing subunit A-like 2 [Acyrthosiphon pisum]|uniref:AAA+ ATPase domain-containing protein n=1 Tax=Acyrthosiphon pisum TaxID=7029 RepID=A0A8R2A574_ACYPI|nr:katanin p60 ATPase-containing subunit A-like 2 [Acyrthosiphon pisum]|eukprot:XP_001946749.2 PREDICTED: katanin p60 ATPase-containing subunit A-like 2 [Acyrthosiphon pisum]
MISDSLNNSTHQGRDYEKKKKQERKKSILYLIENFLRFEGYIKTASTLVEEACLNTSHHVVCDNIDLDTILIEYENYYFLRYQKRPQISKSLDITKSEIHTTKNKTKTFKKSNINQHSQDIQSIDPTFFTVIPMNNCSESLEEEYCLPSIDLSYWKDEWRVYAEIISKEILVTNPNVKWSDIKGLSTPKKLLDEAIVLPTKYPDLFTGLCTPWAAMLFYGPPGTGKTLLAKAVATECKTTFFNITPSTLVAKWRGDSEKLIKVMFEMAEQMSPSTIFIDELDTIASKRIDHEASRRLTSEILIHMDGLLRSEKRIFLLATSNHPWELDPAIFRRLEKRIFVDLPDVQARKDMFVYYLSEMLQKHKYIKCDIDSDSLAQETNGYSGSDIRLVCKETAMQAMRSIFQVLEKKPGNNINFTITTKEVINAISKTKPSTSEADNNKYKIWQSQYASC